MLLKRLASVVLCDMNEGICGHSIPVGPLLLTSEEKTLKVPHACCQVVQMLVEVKLARTATVTLLHLAGGKRHDYYALSSG